MNSEIQPGDTVKFKDEAGVSRIGTVIRILPIGEYSSTEDSVAIEGDYGAYCREQSELEKENAN